MSIYKEDQDLSRLGHGTHLLPTDVWNISLHVELLSQNVYWMLAEYFRPPKEQQQQQQSLCNWEEKIKRRRRKERNRMGPALLEGSHEKKTGFLHWEVPSLAGMAGKAGTGFRVSEKSTSTSMQRAKWRKPCTGGWGLPAVSGLTCLSTCPLTHSGGWCQTPGKGLVLATWRQPEGLGYHSPQLRESEKKPGFAREIKDDCWGMWE